jgi:3-phenylpropionate/cinnamic acid dioxygenase small subunit
MLVEPTLETPTKICHQEATVQQLIDRQEITDLVSRLGLWLDDKRFDEAPRVFTRDVAVQTPGGVSAGISAVAEQARRNHADDRTHHVITNVLVDLDAGEPDRATVRANLLVTFVPDAAAPASRRTLGERYRFAARRTPEGWRLAEVRVEPVWDTAAPAPAAA